MRPGRELDVKVAQEIFKHEVIVKKKILHEVTPLGERPLRNYSREIEFAWPIAEMFKVALFPIENNNWFALAGSVDGWSGPEALLNYLQSGEFRECGAAVGDNVASLICQSALIANEKRRLLAELARLAPTEEPGSPTLQ